MANLGAISFTDVDLSTTSDVMNISFSHTSMTGTTDDTAIVADILLYGDDDAFTAWTTVSSPDSTQQAEITEILARYDGFVKRVDI